MKSRFALITLVEFKPTVLTKQFLDWIPVILVAHESCWDGWIESRQFQNIDQTDVMPNFASPDNAATPFRAVIAPLPRSLG